MLRRRITAILIVALLVPALVGCVSRTSGTPSVIDKHAVPEVGYEIAIYLCHLPAAANGSPCASRSVTVGEDDALTQMLDRDPSVANYLYISVNTSYLLGKLEDPAIGKYLVNGVLPPLYVVALAPHADATAVMAKYQAVAGVDVVRSCALQRKCRLETLRAVGAIR